MKSIRIKNFKAYRDEFDQLENGKIELNNNENFLLYGENGSGKSSIYEAIKVTFYKDKLEESIQSADTPEEQQEYNNEFWSKYKNQNATSNFEIEINDASYKDFDSSDYQVFMIAIDKFCMEDSIRLDELLGKFDFPIENIEIFCEEKVESIQTEINNTLEAFQEKNISVEIDNEDDFNFKIKDSSRGLESKNEISKYFNEAKLNLVILLTLFESIKEFTKNETKTKFLVLDDFITSLDVSNRTFLMRYILDNFSDFQIFIFTHNVYFYNLIMYLVNDIYKTSKNWKYGNLYEISNQHKLYIKGSIETVKEIEGYYKNNHTDIESVGNKIRQRFEVLLYEFSKLLMVGAVEDSKKIIDRIQSNNSIYFKNKENKREKNRTASDLVDDIKYLLDNTTNIKEDIKDKIEEYQKSKLSNIQKTITDLKLYQKITLHPLSHGTIGQSSFTVSEIKESLELLKKLENSIKGLANNDVDGA
ncbi:MAG TPA: hypothetical protein ENK66_06370 [Arcobacter sp.]|nr:hypothetical protein [Arcobacter sp.]